MVDILVVESRLADSTRVIGVLNKVSDYLPGLDLDWYARYLEESVDGRVFFLAYDGDRLVGVAINLRLEDGSYEYSVLAVDPEYWGRGVARSLEEHVISSTPNDALLWTDTFTASDPRGVGIRSVHLKTGFVPAEMVERHGIQEQRFYWRGLTCKN